MVKNVDKDMQARLDALKKMFPEAFTHSHPDLDLLLEKMEEVLVHLGKDHRSDLIPFAWLGKSVAREVLQAPFAGTLYPDKEDENGFQAYDHVFIEGESLEALKMLERPYQEQIEMVYVDPPSPLNHDFVLFDDPEDLLGPFLKLIGEKEGQPDTSWPMEVGARHTRWLNFLYPRLMLAHKLLSDTGLLVMHTSPDELPYMRFMLDSIFGAQKYITTILWQKKAAPPFERGSFECILVYCKHPMNHWPRVIPYLTSLREPYANPDNDPRGSWSPIPVFNETFPILGGLFGRQRGEEARLSPSGKEISPPEGNSWLLSVEEMDDLTADGRLYWGPQGDKVPVLKYFKSGGHQFLFPTCLWAAEEAGTLEDAQKQLMQMVPELSEADIPEHVKPIQLLRNLVRAALPHKENYYSNRIIVDMFGGTGSLFQAVIEQNLEDHFGRRVYSIYLPEPLADPKPGLKTYADVARQRVAVTRNAIEYKTLEQVTFFRMGLSNFKHWEAEQFPCEWIPRKHAHEDEDDEWEDDEMEERPAGPPTELKPDWDADDVLIELILRYGAGFRFTLMPVSWKDESSLIGVMDEYGGFAFSFCLQKKIPFDILRELGELQDECLIMPRSSVDDETFSAIERLYRVRWI